MRGNKFGFTLKHGGAATIDHLHTQADIIKLKVAFNFRMPESDRQELQALLVGPFRYRLRFERCQRDTRQLIEDCHISVTEGVASPQTRNCLHFLFGNFHFSNPRSEINKTQAIKPTIRAMHSPVLMMPLLYRLRRTTLRMRAWMHSEWLPAAYEPLRQ
ncbi:Uncharacterised protein [Enterobacter hormaechei]|nr:Uncharacterised protein [Enterobacter hormaechei]SAB48808.1 Uncharacterised protein [Enterobacter hormaechei]SAG23082.1 Uncharacterised protein [Enterobacter hormaechei]SAI05360.1 Uncharacterised protein [Enterobacter hormaechei]